MEKNFGLHTLDGEWHALLPRYLLVLEALQGKKVLEIGCGRGVGAALLASAGIVDLAAIDHRPDLLQDAQANFDDLQSVFFLMLYEEMGFPDGTFDAVICLDDTFPISDEALLGEVRRVLKDDGVFIGALGNPAAYGLHNILPSFGDALQTHAGAESHGTRERLDVLQRAFDEVIVLSQRPEIGFVFSPPARPDPLLGHSDFAVTQEFTIPRGVDLDDLLDHAPSEPRVLQGEALRLIGHDDTKAVCELVVCTRGGARVSPTLLDPTRVWMPYDALVARLGRIIGDLYRHIDEIDKHHIVIEQHGDESAKLIDDLEEEVRAQRDLARDQAARFDALKEQLSLISKAPDLSLDYARAQGELATRQKEILDLTVDFNRRVQDLTWSLKERDAYIDHLAERVREWESHTQSLEQLLDARQLALETQGRVLERLKAQLSEISGQPPEPASPTEPEPETPEPVEPVEDVIRRALEAERDHLARALAEARARKSNDGADIERAREALARALDEIAERSAYAASLERRIDAQEASALAFAQEVSGTYEELNNTRKALSKANARIEELDTSTTKIREESINVEREMERRSEQILGLKRELMGKEIEARGLERESIRLLQLKSSRDKEVERLEASNKDLNAQLATLKGDLDAANARFQIDLDAANARLQGALDAAASAQAAAATAQAERDAALAGRDAALASATTAARALHDIQAVQKAADAAPKRAPRPKAIPRPEEPTPAADPPKSPRAPRSKATPEPEPAPLPDPPKSPRAPRAKVTPSPHLPTEPASKPAPLAPEPAKVEPKPAEAEPKPAKARQKPAKAESKPAEVEPKPAEAESKPVEAEPKPAKAESKPAKARPKPAEAEPKPVPLAPEPVEVEPKPVETAQKPAKAESKPVEAEQKPTETESKTTRTRSRIARTPPKPDEARPEPEEAPVSPLPAPAQAPEQPPEAPEAPRFSDDWLKAQGYTPAGPNLWTLGDLIAVSTSRYWAQITVLGGNKVKIEGSAARTARVNADRLLDLLPERFGVSTRLAGQIARLAADTTPS